jgi:hypothetical protein
MKWWHWALIGGGIFLVARKSGANGTMSRLLAAHKKVCPSETVTRTYTSSDGFLCFDYTSPKGPGSSCFEKTAGQKSDDELLKTMKLQCG